jgi:hypothetical protein
MSEPCLRPHPHGATGLGVTPLGVAELFVPSSGFGEPRLHSDQVERAFYDHGVNTFLLSPSMKAVAEGVRRLIRAGHRDELVLVDPGSSPTRRRAGACS